MGDSTFPGGNQALRLAAYRKTLGRKNAGDGVSAGDAGPAGDEPSGPGDQRGAFAPGFAELMVFPDMAKPPPRQDKAPSGAAPAGNDEPDTRVMRPWTPVLKVFSTDPQAAQAGPPLRTYRQPPPAETAFPKPTVPAKTGAAKPAMPAKAPPSSRPKPPESGPPVRDVPFTKVVRPLPAGPERTSGDTGSAEDSKYRRVAKFLILIGGEEAAKILSSLEPDHIEAISREIASVRGVTAEEAEEIYAEFRSLLGASSRAGSSSRGGVDAVRQLLYAAFGPDKGEALLERAVPQAKRNPFDFLADFSGEQTAMLLREESPSAAALILSRLPPGQSAETLANLPPERRLEVVKRIAHLGQTNAEILERVAGALREKARRISDTSGGETVALNGRNALAAILKHADMSFGGRLLEELEGEDPDLSQDMKERIHTLEDVIKAEDKPLQEKLRAMSDRDIMLLLKGRSGEFTEKILSNVSASRRRQIREEGDIAGPVLKRDADSAARDFLAWFRQKREEGGIILMDDKDVIV